MAGHVRKWIRRTTTLALIVIVVVIVGAAIQRVRLTRPHLLRLVPRGVEESRISQGEAVGVYEGFEHAESVSGEPVFLLKALRTLDLQSGRYELEDVSLELYRTGVGVATLTCERARYDSESRDTRVEGAVHVEFEDGTFLDTRRGSFNSSARRFGSKTEVVFGGSNFVGRAGGVTYDVEADVAALNDGVTVTAVGGTVLRAPRIVVNRERGLARFPQGLRVVQGDARLNASLARMRLKAPEWRAESVVLSGGVELGGGISSIGSDARGTAERIALHREGAGNWQGRATSSGSWVKLLVFGGDGFVARELKTWELRFVLGKGGILSARSGDATCWLDVPDQGPVRWLESKEGRYYFNGGSVSDVELINDVRMGGGDVVVSGPRARLSLAEGLVLITSRSESAPERVRMRGERTRIWSDELQVSSSEAVAEALGNVQGEIEGANLLGPSGPRKEPTRLACDRLTLLRDEHVAKLRGGARLWQGDRLLLAEEITVNEDGRWLDAAGGVRMTVPSADLGEAEGEEVLIVSRTLHYEEGEGTARFRGGVRLSDSVQLLSTSELIISRAPNGGVEGFVAEERVVLESLESGRRMQGTRGRYSAESGVLTITGDPAHLKDENGNVVSGNTLTWIRANDTVTVSGGEGTPTETIFHPEEEPS